jgi:hypothetical protein
MCITAVAALVLGLLSFAPHIAFLSADQHRRSRDVLLGLGWLCLVLVTGLAAIALGLVGLVQSSNSRGRLRGKGMAIAGLLLGGVSLVVPCLMNLLK